MGVEAGQGFADGVESARADDCGSIDEGSGGGAVAVDAVGAGAEDGEVVAGNFLGAG